MFVVFLSLFHNSHCSFITLLRCPPVTALSVRCLVTALSRGQTPEHHCPSFPKLSFASPLPLMQHLQWPYLKAVQMILAHASLLPVHLWLLLGRFCCPVTLSRLNRLFHARSSYILVSVPAHESWEMTSSLRLEDNIRTCLVLLVSAAMRFIDELSARTFFVLSTHVEP